MTTEKQKGTAIEDEEPSTWGEMLDYLKEYETCTKSCPFYRLGDCEPEQCGTYANGEFREPPCVSNSYENDMPLDEIYNSIKEYRRRSEAATKARIEKRRRRSEAAKKGAETRRKERSYCLAEIQAVKHIKAKIRTVKNAMYFEESLAIAAEMLQYSEKIKPDETLNNTLGELNAMLREAEKKYEEKKAEFKALKRKEVNQ